MNNSEKFPVLKWNNTYYFGEIIFIAIVEAFCLFCALILDRYDLYPFSLRPLLGGPILMLLFGAVYVRLTLLRDYISRIITLTKDKIIKALKVEETSYIIPSWDSYYKKGKRWTIYFEILYIVSVLISYLYYYFYLAKQTHPLNIVGITVIVAGMSSFFLSYGFITAFHVMKYLKEIIDTNISILSDKGKDIKPVEVEWKQINTGIILNWIVALTILALGVALTWLDIIVFWFDGAAIIVFAFLYPTIRLTIDLNIQFNRFSSALERVAAESFVDNSVESSPSTN